MLIDAAKAAAIATRMRTPRPNQPGAYSKPPVLQAKIMVLLADGGATKSRDMVLPCGRGMNAVYCALGKLVARGYVARGADNVYDLTDAGRKVVAG